MLQKISKKVVKYLTIWGEKAVISKTREMETGQKREVLDTPKTPKAFHLAWSREFKKKGDEGKEERRGLLRKSSAATSVARRRKAMSGAGRRACPYCESKNTVRRGKRKKKHETVQLYLCKECGRTFTPQIVKGKHYPLRVILDGLSLYDLGYTLEDTCRLLKEKYGLGVRPATLSNWLEEFEALCRYLRIRKFGKKLYSPHQIIQGINLYHRQIYKFRIHQAKLTLLLQEDIRHRKFWPLKEFLEAMFEECPHHFFKEGQRVSETKVDFNLDKVLIKEKQNLANRLARLVLQAVQDNKLRHEALQQFFLSNDSVTVATEVPVYLLPEDIEHMESQLDFKIPMKIEKVLTGHIDLIQLRNNAVHIMDYKPEAAKGRPPIEQLTLYALALSRLTGLRLYEFKCGWFDENSYFEFFPLHVVYKLRERMPRVPKDQQKLIEAKSL